MDSGEPEANADSAEPRRRIHRKRRAFWKRRQFWIVLGSTILAIIMVLWLIASMNSRHDVE